MKNNVSNYLVVNDRMLFANLSYIYRDSPINILVPFAPNTKVGHHFQTTNALSEKFNKNFIYVGHLDRLKYLGYLLRLERSERLER